MPNRVVNSLIIFVFCWLIGCNVQTDANSSSTIANSNQLADSSTNKAIDEVDSLQLFVPKLEQKMISAGLVDIQKLDSNLKVDLRYASNNNFLNLNVYGAINNAYLTEDCAKKLAIAQAYLSVEKPGYSLLVWDAARPIDVQQRMWDALKKPAEEKTKYVSNPKNHSLHNYGCAVDLTLIDSLGNLVDMGTDFDAFDETAQLTYEWKCVENGKLKRGHIENRNFLRKVMKHGGWTLLPSEWWHFNCCSRDFAKAHYQVVD